MRMRQKRFAVMAVVGVLLLLTTLGCGGSGRRVVVAANVTLVQAVFAVDDAEKTLCTQKILTMQQCADASPVILRALENAKAITSAVQASAGVSVVLPKSVPDILNDLAQVQQIIGPLANSSAAPLVQKINVALDRVASAIAAFAGGAK